MHNDYTVVCFTADLNYLQEYWLIHLWR